MFANEKDKRRYYCKKCGARGRAVSLDDASKGGCLGNKEVQGWPHQWAWEKDESAPMIDWVCKRCGTHERSRDKPASWYCFGYHKGFEAQRGQPHQWVKASEFQFKPPPMLKWQCSKCKLVNYDYYKPKPGYCGPGGGGPHNWRKQS